MKHKIVYVLVLLFPLLVMLWVNESERQRNKEIGYNYAGILAINSGKAYKNKCSWACHNNTNFCKTNHVKFAKSYFDHIDPIYFGIINSLKATGNYGLANIIFLVVLLPLLMYILLAQSIRLQLKIRKLKKA